jgi:hypothetical protein
MSWTSWGAAVAAACMPYGDGICAPPASYRILCTCGSCFVCCCPIAWVVHRGTAVVARQNRCCPAAQISLVWPRTGGAVRPACPACQHDVSNRPVTEIVVHQPVYIKRTVA